MDETQLITIILGPKLNIPKNCNTNSTTNTTITIFIIFLMAGLIGIYLFIAHNKTPITIRLTINCKIDIQTPLFSKNILPTSPRIKRFDSWNQWVYS
jgi:hypothetical protein